MKITSFLKRIVEKKILSSYFIKKENVLIYTKTFKKKKKIKNHFIVVVKLTKYAKNIRVYTFIKFRYFQFRHCRKCVCGLGLLLIGRTQKNMQITQLPEH